LKKTIKRTLVTVFAAGTIFSSAYSMAYADNITVNMPSIIYETTNSKYLSSGVKYENIKKFTTSGWWNINVLRVNLEDKYTKVGALINPDSMPQRGTISSMVEKNNAIAGINGDFFNYEPLPTPLGILIDSGNILASPHATLPAFYMDENNVSTIDYLNSQLSIRNKSKRIDYPLTFINKVPQWITQVALYNEYWGEKSTGNKFYADIVEALIIDNRVRDIRVGGEGFDIPDYEDGYILSARGNTLEGLEIGDRLVLDYEMTPDLDKLKFAIGGGSIILKDGNLSLTDVNVAGNHPRTGIGVNHDSSELLLVTIDGRDSSFVGVSQEMFGAIMKDLGAYNALNMDGGGSTTMAIKPKDEDKAQVINKPSDNTQRVVVNGVGLFSNAPTGKLSRLEISTDDNKMFIGTTRTLVVKGYDQYENPVKLNDEDLKFNVEGIGGELNENEFKPISAGKGKVIIKYDEITSSMDINVLGEVMDLFYNEGNLNIESNSQRKLGDFYGIDNEGTKAKIYLKDIDFSTTGNIGSVKDGVFYSNNISEGGAITAKVGNGVENILVSVGYKGKIVDSFENPNNYNFSGSNNTIQGSLSQSIDAKDGQYSLSLNYDLSQGDNTRAAYLNFGDTGLSLSGKPKKLGLWIKGDGSNTWLRATLKDNAGKEHTIDFARTLDFTEWKYMEANIPINTTYPVKLTRIYAVETNSQNKPVGQILIDGLTAYTPSDVGNLVIPNPTQIKDDQYGKKPVKENGFTFVVGFEPKNLDSLVGYNASSAVQNKISNSKIGLILNGFSKEFRPGLKNYAVLDYGRSYRVDKHYDTLFISLNSSKGGIRATNSSQWTSLMNDLKTREEKNFVLVLPTSLYGSNGFSDKLEADLLHKFLVDAKLNGKNIFVVQGGNNNKSELIDGIRYIHLDTEEPTNAKDIYDIKLAEFVVNPDGISYEINPVFPKPNIK